MEDRGQAFPYSRANKFYYASPGFNTQNQLPTNNVFANTGYGFSNTAGLGHPGNNNNLFNQLYMNNNMNDNFSSAFPFHQGNYLSGISQWQPHIAVPNLPPHPQSNAQLGANVFNAFSVDHLQTRIIPPVVTDNVVMDAEQPSTSSCAFPPRTRDTIPIYQARVCCPMLGNPC